MLSCYKIKKVIDYSIMHTPQFCKNVCVCVYTKTDMQHSDNSLVLGQVSNGILPFIGYMATSGDVFSSQSSENARGMLPNTLKYATQPHKQ